ncbi:MAG TPA: matrixin family metalloprotease, partial [Planctomycetota bacterium]|nr:matrixin family metalloprotease [Planctomycetota bacterium]
SLSEWGSALHGDGEGDPSQPGDVGSGGGAFDFTWQGAAPGVGNMTDNVVSAMTSCGGGVTAFTEVGPGGWRIRVCDDFLWDDGPGTTLSPGALDLQGVLAHELGHAIGLGHSTVVGSTMYPSISGNGVPSRSIEADDSAGVQGIYGVAAPPKPRIDLAFTDGTHVVLYGSGFDAVANEVWFTEAGVNPTGDPVKLTGVVSTQGGTRIELIAPAAAGPGDVLVRVPGTSGAALSNAYPVDPTTCSEPVVYCTAQTNSLGCTSSIGSTGQPSASAGSGFVLSTQELRNNVPGIYFYGKSGPTAQPLLGGWRCALQPLVRMPMGNTGGTPPPVADCSGDLMVDFNAWIAGGSDPALVAGTPVFCQAWSRDAADPSGSNLSDALAFVICP